MGCRQHGGGGGNEDLLEVTEGKPGVRHWECPKGLGGGGREGKGGQGPRGWRASAPHSTSEV